MVRKIFRFIEIVIVGVLLTTFVVTKLTTNLVLDKNTVKKELDKAHVYRKMTEEIKKSIHDDLIDDFNRYPGIGIDLDEMLDNTLKEEVLKEETNTIIDSIYNLDEKVIFDLKTMADNYHKNLNDYLKAKNVTLPKEVEDNINKVLDTSELEKIDISSDMEEVRKVMKDYKSAVDIINLAANIILVTALVIMGIAVLLSTEKLKVIYKPLIFAGVFLAIIRVMGDWAFDMLKIEADDEAVSSLVEAARGLLFSGMDKYLVCFLGLGIGLMVYRNLQEKKEN